MKNLTLLTDFYQLTMMQGYFLNNTHEKKVVFDFFYRKNPDKASYSILAGIEQLVDYVNNLKFTDEDIEYLKTFNTFSDEFLNYLKDLKFTGDIVSFQEGSIILPNEPIIRVTAPIIQCQLIETTLLNIVNHQSLIATKAHRVCNATKGKPVLEFGLRRAQGPDAGLYGSRASIIGGCAGTSNILAGKMFDVPVSGTHAHSWIMSFETEYEAFLSYANIYKELCILLVDTYDTINSGIVNAIKVFNKMKEDGTMPKKIGIRLDSGDLAYLSKKCRKLLDEAGFPEAIISASNDLDEYLIQALNSQGAKIDLYGVGTNLITSKDTPAFGGVYKVSAIEENGTFIPKIKLSNNTEKVTNPGIKKVFRLVSKYHGKIIADLIGLEVETIDTTKDLTIFDPKATWKTKTLKANSFYVREMLQPLFKNGQFVGETKTVKEIREYCLEEKKLLWEENMRLNYPQLIYVDLTDKLYNLKQKMVNEN